MLFASSAAILLNCTSSLRRSHTIVLAISSFPSAFRSARISAAFFFTAICLCPRAKTRGERIMSLPMARSTSSTASLTDLGPVRSFLSSMDMALVEENLLSPMRAAWTSLRLPESRKYAMSWK